MDTFFKKQAAGFTLIELLVVISIISLLSGVVLSSLNSARMKARDGRRLADLRQIQVALELYRDQNGFYPGNTDNDNGGWDTGCAAAGDTFISPLLAGGFMPAVVCDPSITSTSGGYAYYRYSAGGAGCDTARGAYYVLGARNMETSGSPHPTSPGWSCPSRNWQGEFEWVVGKFEN